MVVVMFYCNFGPHIDAGPNAKERMLLETLVLVNSNYKEEANAMYFAISEMLLIIS